MTTPNESKEDLDLDAGIPGLDDNVVVDGGVDAAVEDDGCASGACKL